MPYFIDIFAYPREAIGPPTLPLTKRLLRDINDQESNSKRQRRPLARKLRDGVRETHQAKV